MFRPLLEYVLVLFLSDIVASQTVSIQYVSAYYSQRDCAINCQGLGSTFPPDIVAEDISCATGPIENSCFCRADLQPEAESYIRSCVENYCGNTLDANAAVSIYDTYCTSAGFVKAAATAITTTGTTTGVQTGTQTAQASSATSTNATIGSDTSDSNSSGTTYGGLTKAELIGTIVGVMGVLVSAAGAYYAWKALHR